MGVSGAVSRMLVSPAIAVSCAVGQVFAVVQGKVVARRFGIGVDVFEQAGADVKFLRGPRRFGGFFVHAEVGDGLLRDVGLALLLVVIKEARGRVQIFGIGDQRGMSVVAELAQVLRVASADRNSSLPAAGPRAAESSARRRRGLRARSLGDTPPWPSL